MNKRATLVAESDLNDRIIKLILRTFEQFPLFQAA